MFGADGCWDCPQSLWQMLIWALFWLIPIFSCAVGTLSENRARRDWAKALLFISWLIMGTSAWIMLKWGILWPVRFYVESAAEWRNVLAPSPAADLCFVVAWGASGALIFLLGRTVGARFIRD